MTLLLLATVKYNPIPKICYLGKSTSTLVAVWASPVGSHWTLLVLFSYKRPLAGL